MSLPSRFRRAQQWLLFHRQWHVIDATNQDLFKMGEEVSKYLTGKWKPIWHPETDCGDNVVVVNCKDVAMNAFDWKHFELFFNKGYPKSKALIPAYQIHEYDPCRLMFISVHVGMGSKVFRRVHFERLHLFADAELPDFIKRNIGNQLEQIQTAPRKSTEYTVEERKKFPSLVERPKDYLVEWDDPQPEVQRYETPL
ncbi:hypothetical protein M3Y97_00462600 [Aphelenchoides bicaudatus]|nr:hypothetical protein M3Y97_00462600 [Aphelenchoides bicaudatus]